MPFVMFSKMLQFTDVSGTGDIIKDLGFDGVDLTCREAGHVLPENAARELGPAIDTLRAKGLSVPMLTTGILAADEPHTEAIFAAAAEAGVPALKLGYYRYIEFGTFRAQLDDARRKLEGLAKLAAKYKVSANLHSHSNTFLTAEAGTVYLLVKDFDRAQIGAYVDPGHMYVEGGLIGWQMGLDLLSPWINLVAAKSMGWERVETDQGVQWRTRMFPIHEGLVQWRKVFECLKAIDYQGPVSLHSEYQGGHSWKDLSNEELVEQTRRDLQYMKGVRAEVFG
jgi:L-ribulose-5-phosphate 3-epimerase